MTEASLFRLYAQEALGDSTDAENEIEKRNLIDLALTWAGAALVSERTFGSPFIFVAEPLIGEATP